MIDTIIFDLDGTLIDTERVWDEASRRFLLEFGFKFNREEVKHLLSGQTLNEVVKVFQKHHNFSHDVEECATKIRTHFKEALKDDIKFVDGAESFYESVSKSYKTCVGTSMERELINCVDEGLPITKMFKGNVFSIDDIGRIPKPNPDIFLYAAKKMDSLPETCVVVEDSPYGIEAARRAGMKSIGITNTYPREKLSHASLVVDYFREIDLSFL